MIVVSEPEETPPARFEVPQIEIPDPKRVTPCAEKGPPNLLDPLVERPDPCETLSRTERMEFKSSSPPKDKVDARIAFPLIDRQESSKVPERTDKLPLTGTLPRIEVSPLTCRQLAIDACLPTVAPWTTLSVAPNRVCPPTLNDSERFVPPDTEQPPWIARNEAKFPSTAKKVLEIDREEATFTEQSTETSFWKADSRRTDNCEPRTSEFADEIIFLARKLPCVEILPP